MAVAWRYNEDGNRLEILMTNYLGVFSPLRNEHGREIDFLPEHLHAGGKFTEASFSAFAGGFTRIDDKFNELDCKL